MSNQKEAINATAERELTITRIINAPREIVFKAWTDPVQLANWWGPKGFSSTIHEADARPGGKIYIEMKAPDGTIYPMDGEFCEINPPERLVFISAALDKDNKRLFEILNTVTFADVNGKTKLTLHVRVSKIRSEDAHYLDGMNQGWNGSLDRLTQFVQ